MKRRTFAEKMMVILVFVIFFLNISATVFLLFSVRERVTYVGKASEGTTMLCINTPPSFNFTCSQNMLQGTPYNCTLNASDPNQGSTFTYTQFYNGTPIFTLSPDGVISFTPDNYDIGQHSTIFMVDDNTGCNNSRVNMTWEFNVTNVNDAPVLVVPIPDIEILPNQTYAFYLSDHFIDPDGDPMTYNYTPPIIPVIDLLIRESSSTTVRSEVCDVEDDVIFIATDPYGLYGTSNSVKIKIECPEDFTGGTGAGTGAGGGGGGGAALICDPEWDCSDWMVCLPTGYQWRHCYDLHGCEDTKYFKRECDYVGPPPECEENWLCTDWGPCLPNGTQYRTCDDLNECGSTLFMPMLDQSCHYNPTCSDGIKNGDETGVDCGGSCPACPILEVPGFVEQTRFEYWLLIALLVAAVLVAGVGRLYHEQIAQGIARLTFLLAHHKQKKILLTEAEKHELFEKLSRAERLAFERPDLDADSKYALVTRVGRRFFEMVLKLPSEFTNKEIAAALLEQRKKLPEEVVKMLVSFFNRIYYLEAAKYPFDEAFFLSYSEELRSMICAFSEYQVAEIERPLRQLTISEELSFIQEMLIRFVNTYRALQYQRYDLAREEYAKLLHLYEDLPHQDKEPAFDELTRLFTELKYFLERGKSET